MSEHWREKAWGRPARTEHERATSELPCPDVMGWRREHAARVWQALQGVSLLACVTGALIGKAVAMLAEQRQREQERDAELMAAVARLSTSDPGKPPA